MRHLLIALGLVLSLSGCFATTGSTQPIPSSFLQPCEALLTLKGTTGKDMLENITENAAIHFECADGKQALIDAVKARDKIK